MTNIDRKLKSRDITLPTNAHRVKGMIFLASLDGSVGKESACNAGDPGSVPGSGRSSGGRHGNLPGESHGQRSLVGFSPWGCKEFRMTM